jgi:hypothetical protein
MVQESVDLLCDATPAAAVILITAPLATPRLVSPVRHPLLAFWPPLSDSLPRPVSIRLFRTQR